MKKISTEMLSFFRALTRLRRVWHEMRPMEEISKSLFATLMAIAHAGDTDAPDYVPVTLINGAISVKELANLTHTTLPSISQKIKTLEESGYVKRIADAEDRRICRIKLTKSGEEMVEKAHTLMEERMEKTIDDFGAENIEALVTMIDRLSESIEKQNQEYTTHKEKNLC